MYCSQCGAWAPDDHVVCTTCRANLHPQAVPAPPSIAPDARRLERSDYGGFWRRGIACLVDGFLFIFPEALLRLGLGLELVSKGWAELQDPRAWRVSIAIGVLSWLYSAVLESSPLQGTLGQRLLGLRVTNVTGGRIGFGRATARHIGQWASGLTLGIGYLMNLWTARRQTLHDYMAGTLVVRDRPSREAP